jgi:D-aminoacyl-tRNA deacylase
MKTAIIIWAKCPVGNNIKQRLLELFNFEIAEEKFDNNQVYQFKENNNIKLYTINTKHVDANNLDKRIKAEQFIFATTHRAESGKPSLSYHTPGNWNKAKLGGFDKKLCIAPALLLKKAFLELNKLNSNSDYNVTLECTHHGPYLEKPCMYIEIGSSEKQWNDKNAAIVNAKVIMNILKDDADNKEKRKNRIAIGLGGLHYCDNFNKVLLRTNIAIGHICPKYSLQYLDEEMLIQAFNKTTPNPEIVLLDWKGLGQFKQKVIQLLDKLDLKYDRVQKIY